MLIVKLTFVDEVIQLANLLSIGLTFLLFYCLQLSDAVTSLPPLVLLIKFFFVVEDCVMRQLPCTIFMSMFVFVCLFLLWN